MKMKLAGLLLHLSLVGSLPPATGAEDRPGPLAPWLARPGAEVIREDFSPGKISARWFFTEWWATGDGLLLRNELPGKNKRLFWKKPVYRDSVISFSFSFRGAEEIRLMSGTSGKYNFVILLRRDHFRVNTASDSTVPHLPSIQGECAFRFDPEKWYRLQVEVLGEEILARIDDEHFVVGRHPIIDRERSYFAFQVDGPSAAFDRIRLSKGAAVDGWAERRARLEKAQAGRVAVPRTLAERHKDRKVIARDRAWRIDPRYRELVESHERFRESARNRFPAAYLSAKTAKKKVSAKRKALLKNDPAYKELTRTINKARREETRYLEEKHPGLSSLPSTQYKAELQRLRARAQATDPAFNRLLNSSATLEKKLLSDYPQLSLTNEEVVAKRRAAIQELNESSPAFRESSQKIAQAWRALQNYLLESDPELARLEKELQAEKKKRRDK